MSPAVLGPLHHVLDETATPPQALRARKPGGVASRPSRGWAVGRCIGASVETYGVTQRDTPAADAMETGLAVVFARQDGTEEHR